MNTSIRVMAWLVGAAALSPGWSWGFAEDVCWLPDGAGVTSCTPLPDACLPVGTTSNACRSAAVAANAAAQQYGEARSSVHVDATYVMAQAVGFSADDAYWIAAYDQVADLGSFEPVDLAGVPVGDGALATATLDGIVRTNLPSGGLFFHFVSPRNGGSATVPAVDGLHPDVEDGDTEGFLVHLRSWALAGSGTTRPACTDGLTVATADGLSLGASCFARAAGGDATITGSIALFGPTASPFVVSTGPQTIQRGVTSEAFDEVVGGDAARIADARLGIYLHALADRISHHVCTDRTVLAGPTGIARSFSVDLGIADCTQGLHALRHMWEIGTEQDLLADEDRTLAAALTAVYDELLVFAAARGTLAVGADDDGRRDALVAELIAAIESPDAATRLEAVRAAGCSRGLAAFPGLAACPPLPPPGADAGAGVADAGDDGGGLPGGCCATRGGGAADVSIAVAVIGLLLTPRRRRAI